MNETQAEKVVEKIYDVPPEWRRRAYADEAKYREMYAHSVKDPNGFWGEQAKRVDWITPFTKVENVSFAPGVSQPAKAFAQSDDGYTGTNVSGKTTSSAPSAAASAATVSSLSSVASRSSTTGWT